MLCERLFRNINIKNGAYNEIFKRMRPYLIQKLKDSLETRILCPSGRKRNPVFLEKFFDALYYILDSGSQFKHITEFFGLSKGTFYWYLNWIIDHSLLETIYTELIDQLPSTDLMITDTFTVKSMMGSGGLGRNPVDRGRKGMKVSLICDTNRVVRGVGFGGANKHDVRLLSETIDNLSDPCPGETVSILCDSGYVGKRIRQECRRKNFRLIVKPRRTRKKGKMSHILLKTDAELLKNNRNLIELLNGNIRRFRSLMIKWVRNMETYQCLLYLSLLCITCYQLFVHTNN
jgi:hypothetical protein